MNIDEIKRNLRQRRNISQPSLADKKPEPVFKSPQPVFVGIIPEETEEEKVKPESEIWERSEGNPSSFYKGIEESPPRTKTGRPRKAIINNGTNKPLREYPVDPFISQTDLQDEKYDWRRDTKRGVKSRLNFTNYLKDFLESDYPVEI